MKKTKKVNNFVSKVYDFPALRHEIIKRLQDNQAEIDSFWVSKWISHGNPHDDRDPCLDTLNEWLKTKFRTLEFNKEYYLPGTNKNVVITEEYGVLLSDTPKMNWCMDIIS